MLPDTEVPDGSSEVQNLQRVACTGISDKQCGQDLYTAAFSFRLFFLTELAKLSDNKENDKSNN